MSIRVLPKIVADKIAAGEVIERPASVVKELVENSIDAGARRIEVELEDGGAKLIRVADDGCGMDETDLALAFLSHSTSKLASEDDLFNVQTMGFRGEALASVAAVSQARIVSRRRESDSGHCIEAEGGDVGEVKASGAPPGTQIEVRNLFYNVPVRRKFLKSPATEMAHVTETVTRLSLAYPDIHFALRHNGRVVFNLPPSGDRRVRVGEFFGREIADNIIPFSARHPDVEIEGYLLPPSVTRAGAVMQYTYVNHRFIRDKVLMRAIAEAYQGLLMSQRRPVCFLFLTLDPREVDVNVHPTKIEIRFRRGHDVYLRLLQAMRDALRQAKLTPQISISTGPSGQQQEVKESIRQAVVDFFAGTKGNGEAPRPALSFSGGPSAPSPIRSEAPGHAPSSPAAPTPEPSREAPMVQVRYGGGIQVLDTYIIEEEADGIRVIDQHALHERILYNAMRERLSSGPLASQRLLVPELVEMRPSEFAAVMELKDDLARFGMEVETFGESTIIVRSFPQILGRFSAKAFFDDLMEELEGPEGARRVDGRLDRLIKLIACRGAIKAGERLGPEQMRRLLEQRATSGQTDTCPHGRPTMILITRAELERQFKRT